MHSEHFVDAISKLMKQQRKKKSSRSKKLKGSKEASFKKLCNSQQPELSLVSYVERFKLYGKVEDCLFSIILIYLDRMFKGCPAF